MAGKVMASKKRKEKVLNIVATIIVLFLPLWYWFRSGGFSEPL